MKTFSLIISSLTLVSGLSVMAAEYATPFKVEDILEPKPIEGQLGEPGAPSLRKQQASLAKALLNRGLCNESFYGAEFCVKQQSKTFRVTDEIGKAAPERSVKTDSEVKGKF
ncbi:MAG: hypothetical protein H7318_10995 [Oligoflexus sp.]|nr:hypothetical protein [Oligoflexus sp.]